MKARDMLGCWTGAHESGIPKPSQATPLVAMRKCISLVDQNKSKSTRLEVDKRVKMV